jgi:arylformamidase
VVKLYRDFETQEEIDAQYRVASSPENLVHSRVRAQTLSAEARCKLQHKSSVAYGPTKSEYLDIFPSAFDNAPVFIFFHGGYWRAMSAADYSFVAVGPASRGFLTVSVNYALAPRVSLDEIVRQARAAVAWVMTNIQEYGGDPNRLVIGGHSAGAQLAAMSVLTDWPGEYGLDPQSIRGALLISGLFELAPLRYSFLQPQLQLDDRTILHNSPANLVRELRTPLMLAVGERESNEFHRQTKDFYDSCMHASNDSVIEIVPDADHFQAVEPLLDANSGMCKWMLRHT